MANFIIGTLIGFVLGFLIAYRTVIEMLDELDENDKGEMPMELKANLKRPRPWRIGVDCDNVINNLAESIIDVYNKDYNDNLSIADITTYNMRQFFKNVSPDKFCDYFTDKRVWDNIKVLENCVATLKKYHDLGCEIYIVTATAPQNVSNKATWLQEQLPFLNMYDSLIVIKNKQMLSGDIDILIDDCVDNLVGGYYHKILFDYPWNRYGFESYESIIHMLHQKYRCKNWNDIDEAINIIIKTDMGTEIKLDLKPENIESIESEQKIDFVLSDNKE